MKVIVSNRGGGKTHALLEWMRRTPGSVMLCFSIEEALRLASVNRDIERSRFIGPGQRTREPVSAICIDNLDIFLKRVFGGAVEAVSLSGEGFVLDHPAARRASREMVRVTPETLADVPGLRQLGEQLGEMMEGRNGSPDG